MKWKAFLALVGLIVFGVSYAKAKAAERSRNRDAAYEYFLDLCGGQVTNCAQQLDAFFNVCFAAHYRFELRPGRDHLEFEPFVACLNGKYGRPLFKVEESTDSTLPFAAQ